MCYYVYNNDSHYLQICSLNTNITNYIPRSGGYLSTDSSISINHPTLASTVSGGSIRAGVSWRSDGKLVLSGDAYMEQIGDTNDPFYSSQAKVAWISDTYVSTDGEPTASKFLHKFIRTKTINVGALSNSSNKTIAHNCTNIDLIWIDSSKSFVVASSGATYMIPRITSVNLNQTVAVSVNKTNVTISTGSDANFTRCYITVNYICD